MTPPARLKDFFSLRLAGFYATLGVATGIGQPFFPVWLESKGLGAGEIGVVLAIPMVVRMFFVPLTTRLADRFNTLRGAIIIATVGSAVGNAAIGLSDGFLMIAVLMAASAIFFTPTFPLADAYALRGLPERGKSYGPVRLWSSAAYIVANVGSGFVIGVLPRPGIIWLITCSFVIGIGLAWLLIPISIHAGTPVHSAAPKTSLWRSPAFVAIVISCGATQASHAVYYGFSTIDWTGKGLSNLTVGGLWALGVIVEIGLFAISGRLARYVSPVSLVIAGALGGLVRWTAMAFDPPIALLPLLQCLHALSFCATHIGAMQFLARVVSPGQSATAQGDFAAAGGMIFAAAMGVSGLLFRSYGDLAYLAMALLTAIGLVGALAGKYFMRKTTPAPLVR
jgi:PPP family 3-phenylpropionic acid transporter